MKEFDWYTVERACKIDKLYTDHPCNQSFLLCVHDTLSQW